MSWFVAAPLLFLLLFYLVLLFRPIPLPFVGGTARALVLASMPDNMDLELGATYLSLKDGVAPAIRFSPVVLTDRTTGGKIEMEALEIGFSAFRAVLGQPGAEITMVAPRLQVIQDLFGPRLAQFELVDDPEGGHGIVRVYEGETALPRVSINNRGLGVRGDILGSPALSLRSDNDWLIYNLSAGERGLRTIIANTNQGLFSKFSIRDGILEMHDSVYGLVRTFSDIDLQISSKRGSDRVVGTISAGIGGGRMRGTILRRVDADGTVHLINRIRNLDFSAFMPFMDDPDGQAALHGTGNVRVDVSFSGSENVEVLGGRFLVDMNGMKLRIQKDFFPLTADEMVIDWDAAAATFDMQPTHFKAGKSSADISGTFVMGLDENFGPTMRMTTHIQNIYLQPLDMGPPEKEINELQFIGWSAPLYGAMGIEQFAVHSGDLKMVGHGRVNLLQSGVGLDMNVAIEGATADDLKRLWPYFLGGDTRDWFVRNVRDGRVVTSAMRFSFPVGSLRTDGEEITLPDDAINVQMLARDVVVNVADNLAPVTIAGISHLNLANGKTTIGFGNAVLETDGGNVGLNNSRFSFKWDDAQTSTFEFDGSVNSSISALLALQKEVEPDALANVDLPLDPSALSGRLDSSLTARIRLSGDQYDVTDLQYSLEGKLSDFASSVPVADYTIGNGQFDIVADNEGYRVNGPVDLNGLRTNLSLSGTARNPTSPSLAVSATFDAEDFKQFGFDVTRFITGKVRFTGRPQSDGTLDVSVDLKDAAMHVADIGLNKSVGSAGSLSATVSFDDPVVDISDIDLKFGNVRLQGGLKYHQRNGLQSADFSRFAINEGDDAQIQLAPVSGGYSVRLRGKQLDLKPLMRRFFSLESGGTGGPQATSVNETILLDVAIERALGFYSTTAFNLNANLSIRGPDLKNVALQAQFGGANALSITTNPGATGRVMSMAFGDLGTLLRFVGIYPRLAGGTGSLVLTANDALHTDVGDFVLRNFSLINEDNVAQVLGNHPDSRAQIARQNRVDFKDGRVRFVRHPDKIEILDAVLDGGTQGGTARGFIYTDSGQYDIVGTYIPLFGLNNAFQQIPVLGRLLGGRDGEGLFGVTFAVRGPLADPKFSVNPLSLLVPGAFRSLFEFRAQEQQ